MTVFLPCLWVDGEKRAVGNRSYLSITPSELDLDVPNRAMALQQRHLSSSYLGSDEITRARALQFLQRLDPKHFEEGGIRIDDLGVQGRDVNSFLQTQRELTERLRIGEVAKTLLFPGLSGGLGTTHIDASANGMSVALMEG